MKIPRARKMPRNEMRGTLADQPTRRTPTCDVISETRSATGGPEDSLAYDAIDAFFKSLVWAVKPVGPWIGDNVDIEFTSDHIVLPQQGNIGLGVVLRGEGWHCTDGSCGFEDLTGRRVRRETVVLVDLAATKAALATAVTV